MRHERPANVCRDTIFQERRLASREPVEEVDRIRPRVRLSLRIAAAVVCLGVTLWAPTRVGAEVVSYQKGDGKGSVSETDDTTMLITVPDTTWIDDGQDPTHFEIDRSTERHSILKFPNIFGNSVNQIPPGSLILSATLTVYLDNEGTDCPDVYQLSEGWTELEATWNSRRTGVAWSDAGADGPTSHKTTLIGTLPCLLPIGFKNVDVTSSVQNWSNGELNEGWVFVDQGGSNNGSNYRSSEHATQGDRPMLTVTYQPSVFYSVGTNPADLKTGSPTITIASGTATISTAQTNHIGVGDVIDHDTDNKLVYIWDVISPTQFRVQTATGTVPTDVAGVTVNSIQRAFNSIVNAVTQSSDASHLNNADLTAVGRRLTWVCYNDGPFNETVNISGYTTDASHFITLTVAGSAQVASGRSQRHTGVSGTGTVLRPPAAAAAGFSIREAFTRLEWMEIDGTNVTIGASDGVDLGSGLGPNAELQNLLVHGWNQPSDDGIFVNSTDAVIRNTILHTNTGSILIFSNNATVHNTSIYGATTIGIRAANSSTGHVLENVIAMGTPSDFSEVLGGTFASVNNCISEDNTADDFGGAGNQILLSPQNQFRSIVGAIDLHLRAGADAIDAGKDLSASFTGDIDDETRHFAAGWDVGADETAFATGATNYRSIGTAAAYGTGTIDVTNNSDLVTGTGTAWRTANRGRGDVITIPCADPPTCTGGVDYTMLSVNSESSLRLTDTFAAGTASGLTYLIRRQFTTFSAWETCVDGNPCAFFPVASNDLVADDRREVGIAYDDSQFDLSSAFVINGSVTDATHTITLTADGDNRHYGSPNGGVVVDGQNAPNEIIVRDSFVTIEWLEIVRVLGADGIAAVRILGNSGDIPTDVVVQNVLIHAFADASFDVSGIRFSGLDGKTATVRNCMIWDGDAFGIEGDGSGDAMTIENCSIDNIADPVGEGIATIGSDFTVLNTIVTRSGSTDFITGGGSFNAASSNNMDSDGSAPGANALTVLASDVFTTPGTDLHLKTGVNPAVDAGVDRSFINDIDGDVRAAGSWDRGADERAIATAVALVSYTATSVDAAVELAWETASELDNLGFHLYRSTSLSGPYVRITPRAIPGLGSSPVGARYRFRDDDVAIGVRYYYELEDIETTGRAERHGPVSATVADGATPDDAAPAQSANAMITFGEPSRNAFRVLERGRSHVVVELKTRGFHAVPRDDGTVELSVPGLETLLEPAAASVPVKRAWVDAVPGRRVTIASVRAFDVRTFAGLEPGNADAPAINASVDGTVRASTQRVRSKRGRRVSHRRSRVVETAFQGDRKKVLLELAPLEWHGSSHRLKLAERLVVRLVFRGREASERSIDGKRWRRYRSRRSHDNRNVVAQLATGEPGLYGLTFEELIGGRGSVRVDRLRLSRQGEAVAFHVEPDSARFRRGSTLYFVSEGADANPYGTEAVYEVELGAEGARMPVVDAAPDGEIVASYWAVEEREDNRIYQAGLVDAPDLWLWDTLFAPERKSYPFRLDALSTHPERARLTVWLQGASDLAPRTDHHVRLYVNDVLVDELTWDGKSSPIVETALEPDVLRPGDNELAIENVGDTGAAYSMVMLNRFSVRYPRPVVAATSELTGTFDESGVAQVSGLDSRVRIVDVSEEPPRWLTGASEGATASRFRVEAGRSYRWTAASQLKRPAIRRPSASPLKSSRRGADYVVIGPTELLVDVEPLIRLREGQGLRTARVSTESIYETFGFGESTPQAIQDFLAFAYHRWRTPPRYVLLVGDASFDYKDYLGTGVQNLVPPMMARTTFLWTASDPAYAAVNGDDRLPDLAIGRLSAASRAEVRTMVEKIVAFDESGYDLSGSIAVVVDDPDEAGAFESAAEELIGGELSARDVDPIYLSTLGVSATRERIRSAFENGSSVVTYVGHGGINLWADENIFNASDVDAITRHARQPLLLTLNCLNGYFHFPYFDALAEKLVKSDGKGAIAAISPSGLSLNGPAHRFHQAVMYEIVSGGHKRLGDAVLAAQERYAAIGVFPELLSIYHLFGDPALRLNPR